MAEHPASLIVLFIGGLVVTVAVGGAIADQAVRIDGAVSGSATDTAADVRTDIEILNDPGGASGEYNATDDTLTLYVKNVGKRTVPHDESTIDVLVDGRYVSETNVTLLDGATWTTGVVLEIRATVNLTQRTTHRAKVVVDGAQASYEFRAGPPPADPVPSRSELVYANGASELRSIAPDGTVTAYSATVAAIGPTEIDFDGDDRLEIPYVTSGGDVKLIDDANETTTVASGDAKTSSALLGVGTWRGETSVFYVNTSDSDAIYRVRPGASPTKVTAGGSPVDGSAVSGVADYSDDGDPDLTFLGTSQEVKYVDGDAVRSTGAGPGSNSNYGVGAPRKFDGSAPLRAPLVDGSNAVQLLAADGTTTTVLGSGAEKTPLAGLDWTGDDDLEIMYVNASSDTLYYVTLGASTTEVTDADGNTVSVDTGVGVA